KAEAVKIVETGEGRGVAAPDGQSQGPDVRRALRRAAAGVQGSLQRREGAGGRHARPGGLENWDGGIFIQRQHASLYFADGGPGGVGAGWGRWLAMTLPLACQAATKDSAASTYDSGPTTISR